MSDVYGMSTTDRILSGSKVTIRMNEPLIRPFRQGIEISDINHTRSCLPIVGRNSRYKIIDVMTTGSISANNYFLDVDSTSDAGLGQDVTTVIEGTLYNRSPWVVNGLLSTTGASQASIRNYLIFIGLSGAALEQRLQTWIKSVLAGHSSEWEVHPGIVDTVPYDEVYYEAGTYSSIEKANVKFPDGRIKQTISFELNTEDYGYGKEYIDSVPFFDLAKYEPIEYIHNSGPTGMFPIVGSYVSYDEKLSFNGIIEPFEIRKRALGLNIFLEEDKQPGTVFAEINRSEILFSHDSRENNIRAEFFEDVGTKGFSGYGTPMDQAQTLLEAEYLSDYSKNSYPFKERDNADLLISDSGIKSVQLSMDPTLDEGILPITHVDSCVGFDSVSRDRINSIVFRSMTRG